eukprot:12725-Heterococcus_DN1.PRE.2
MCCTAVCSTVCCCRAENDEVKKNVPTSEVDCGMFAVDTTGVRALLLAKVHCIKYTAVAAATAVLLKACVIG